MKKAIAAILGYGTVGSGVAEVIRKNKEVIRSRGLDVTVKYILDLRDFPGDPEEKQIVHDVEVILNDPEVNVICETMGGQGAAYQFTKRALEKGISVCTSNKELVEAKGAELIRIATEHRCSYLFEASVGGGIPLIRTLGNALTAERIRGIYGILNGTTNYILTRMKKDGEDFDDVLKEAQAKGYAEKDPTADIEGHDACRKIAILASLVTGKKVYYEDIPMEGITKIGQEDFAYADALGRSIKLIAQAEFGEDGLHAMVSPRMIPEESPLNSAHGVFNAVLIRSDMLDDSMYYGRGAGKLATASAVVGDLFDAATHAGETVGCGFSDEKMPMADMDSYPQQYFVRFASGEEGAVAALFGGEIVKSDKVRSGFGIITESMSEADFRKKYEAADGAVNYIRLG